MLNLKDMRKGVMYEKWEGISREFEKDVYKEIGVNIKIWGEGGGISIEIFSNKIEDIKKVEELVYDYKKSGMYEVKEGEVRFIDITINKSGSVSCMFSATNTPDTIKAIENGTYDPYKNFEKDKEYKDGEVR